MAIHNNYEKMSDTDREVVDECFQGIYDHLMHEGYALAGDDRAEILVEAIATYIEQCRRR